MVGSHLRFAAAAVFFLQVAGCSSTHNFDYAANEPVTAGGIVKTPSHPLECVGFCSRAHSGIDLRGDAFGLVAAGRRPLCPRHRSERRLDPRSDRLCGAAPLPIWPWSGDIISPREIRVDHANWLNDGAIYLSDPIVDVSPENNWSEVRVYNQRAASWGRQTYLVQGFIGPGRLPKNPEVGRSRLIFGRTGREPPSTSRFAPGLESSHPRQNMVPPAGAASALGKQRSHYLPHGPWPKLSRE